MQVQAARRGRIVFVGKTKWGGGVLDRNFNALIGN